MRPSCLLPAASITALLVVTVTCTCPQGNTTAFEATFDADTLGGAPSTSGPFGPPGTTLAAAGDLEVIAPAALSTRAVRMDRPNAGDSWIEAKLATPIASGIAYVVIEGFGETVPLQQIAAMTVGVRSSTDEPAAVLSLFDGSYKVVEGATTVDLPGTYDPGDPHSLIVTLDLDARTFSVCVGASELIAGRSFASSSATDIDRVKIVVPAALTEAFASVFVVDKLRVGT